MQGDYVIQFASWRQQVQRQEQPALRRLPSWYGLGRLAALLVAEQQGRSHFQYNILLNNSNFFCIECRLRFFSQVLRINYLFSNKLKNSIKILVAQEGAGNCRCIIYSIKKKSVTRGINIRHVYALIIMTTITQ